LFFGLLVIWIIQSLLFDSTLNLILKQKDILINLKAFRPREFPSWFFIIKRRSSSSLWSDLRPAAEYQRKSLSILSHYLNWKMIFELIWNLRDSLQRRIVIEARENGETVLIRKNILFVTIWLNWFFLQIGFKLQNQISFWQDFSWNHSSNLKIYLFFPNQLIKVSTKIILFKLVFCFS